MCLKMAKLEHKADRNFPQLNNLHLELLLSSFLSITDLICHFTVNLVLVFRLSSHCSLPGLDRSALKGINSLVCLSYEGFDPALIIPLSSSFDGNMLGLVPDGRFAVKTLIEYLATGAATCAPAIDKNKDEQSENSSWKQELLQYTEWGKTSWRH